MLLTTPNPPHEPRPGFVQQVVGQLQQTSPRSIEAAGSGVSAFTAGTTGPATRRANLFDYLERFPSPRMRRRVARRDRAFLASIKPSRERGRTPYGRLVAAEASPLAYRRSFSGRIFTRLITYDSFVERLSSQSFVTPLSYHTAPIEQYDVIGRTHH